MGETGYRLHRTDLPGTPDVAFIGRRKAIFVHGCFWHGQDCKRGSRTPKTNRDYWTAKIARNEQLDRDSIAALEALGWGLLVIWECELREPEVLTRRLAEFLRATGWRTTNPKIRHIFSRGRRAHLATDDMATATAIIPSVTFVAIGCMGARAWPTVLQPNSGRIGRNTCVR